MQDQFSQLSPGHARVAKASAARLQNIARRAVDDPVALEKAARIVRIALARQKLTAADLVPTKADKQTAAAS